MKNTATVIEYTETPIAIVTAIARGNVDNIRIQY